MILLARIKLKPGTEAAAEAALRKQIEYCINEEPGTELYLMHRAQDDPTTLLFYERYTDSAALDKHHKSAFNQTLLKTLQPMLEGAPTLELFEDPFGKGCSKS